MFVRCRCIILVTVTFAFGYELVVITYTSEELPFCKLSPLFVCLFFRAYVLGHVSHLPLMVNSRYVVSRQTYQPRKYCALYQLREISEIGWKLVIHNKPRTHKRKLFFQPFYLHDEAAQSVCKVVSSQFGRLEQYHTQH